MKQKLVIATVTRGASSPGWWDYHRSTRKMTDFLRQPVPVTCEDVHGIVDVAVEDMPELEGTIQLDQDVCKARARIVRKALEMSSADWFLWWDDDIGAEPQLIVLMIFLANKHGIDILGAPYPRKAIREAEVVAAALAGKEHPLRYGYCFEDFAIMKHTASVDQPPSNALFEVDGIGLGFCLTSRKCLQEMTEAYREADGFIDQRLGGETVGMFTFARGEDRHLPSEDYAFCARWKALGHKIFAYCGNYSPVRHVGIYTYEAHPDCLRKTITKTETK
jgi:hypothetical protein